MIVVASLWDREAFPWQSDWYRSRVEEHLGESTDDNFRLWYVDHALHHDGANQEDPTRTISYLGVLQQALRDVAAWVENGVAPPASTDYVVVDGQVQVPPTAAERKGIQPVVTLTANGGERADVRVGEPVTFSAGIEVPPVLRCRGRARCSRSWSRFKGRWRASSRSSSSSPRAWRWRSATRRAAFVS